MTSVSPHAAKRKPKADHNDVTMRLCDIHPSPENDTLYRPVDPTDPSIIAMAKSMRERGVLEPLVISMDGYILSGHRRYCAAKLAGLEHVPVRIHPIRRSDDIDAFVVLLREYNRQRVKSLDEQIREAVIDADPDESYAELADHRREKAKGGMPAFC